MGSFKSLCLELGPKRLDQRHRRPKGIAGADPARRAGVDRNPAPMIKSASSPEQRGLLRNADSSPTPSSSLPRQDSWLNSPMRRHRSHRSEPFFIGGCAHRPLECKTLAHSKLSPVTARPLARRAAAASERSAYANAQPFACMPVTRSLQTVARRTHQAPPLPAPQPSTRRRGGRHCLGQEHGV